MIESIEFTNFKALRQTTLPLAPFTLLLGPNGSGKSTVLQSLGLVKAIAEKGGDGREKHVNSESSSKFLSRTASIAAPSIELRVQLRLHGETRIALITLGPNDKCIRRLVDEQGAILDELSSAPMLQWLSQMQVFALDPTAIAQPAQVGSGPLQSNGSGLAAVLDDLKDNHEDRWQLLLAEMAQWLPEYDSIQFDKPQHGIKRIALRTKKGGHRIPAMDLSQGTLVALALLTLAHLPNPPSLIGLEEIDRGLHPRLLRHLQDALYRLSYPESCGEKRPAIQVIATTHSPYLLDLYRDHPEEVVLAQKEGLEVQMTRLADIEHFDDILGDASLSDIWYSGVFGGVAVKP